MKNVVLLACLFCASITNAQFAKYVNPFIGTGGTGHTFPGATTPFALVQLSPDTRIDGSWEGCSGYHYSDSIIHGFSHTHLSGTGCSDYGDIAFMPWFSKKDDFEKLKTWDVHSKFSHKNEKASAGFYSVVLDDIPVKVELTATTRTGFQRYTFNDDGFGYIVLNLKHRDELLEGSIHEKANLTFSGIRRSKAWATNQELYYAVEMHSPLQANMKGFYNYNYIVKEGTNDTKLIIRFRTYKGLQVLIKTGLSSCDEQGAFGNLNTENPTWDFEKIKQQAFNSWEKELTKIEVEDAKLPNKTKKLKDNLSIFYTALYHCMIHPSIMNDVDGRYKGRDGKIHKAEGFNYYTVFSLWDTHRALHPLLNIIDKKRSHDFVITFLKQFEQSGRLPMWELWNNETDCMIGFHSVSVILDAYRKDVITKDELQQLWPAVKAEAMSNRFGLDKFREKGYLSIEDEHESVSKTLEYSYDMWCVSEIALELKLYSDYDYYRNLSWGYESVFNYKTNFMQPRKNGNWLANFNPYEVNNNYTEANAWQYSFYIPHLIGAVNRKMLDSLFVVNSKTNGREQADITGLIGQYAHGNEPSHNYIYLLNDTNRIKYLHYVYDNFYTNATDGLIGNEDCGQMSAWYVMSALGFYQTCPGEDNFELGLPLFKEAKIKFSKNKVVNFKKQFNKIDYKAPFCFTSKKGKREDFFISMFSSKEIFRKGEKIFTNSKKFPLIVDEDYEYDGGGGRKLRPCCQNCAPLIIPSSEKHFTDSLKISIEYYFDGEYFCEYNGYYVIDDGLPIKYTNSFYISKNSSIKAFSVDTNYSRNDTSNLSIAHFYKRPHNYSIKLNCTYNKQYTADGDDGIIDGLYGDKDWRKGGWQGYQSQDFEAVIDMKEVKNINEISANFLQDTRSWILFPCKVEFYTSTDNINFTLLETVTNTIPANEYSIQNSTFKIQHKKTAQFIKVKATNYGKLPNWHQGKGGDAFIFIDEIEVK
jgi:predicted alpha-1,2-mannosidase